MKRYIALLVLLAGFQHGSSQGFEKRTDLSLYFGVQNPVEIAIIDFNGSGPGDHFEAGLMAGIGSSRKSRRISLGLRATYMHNELKNFTDVEQNTSLHTVAFQGDFWVNLLNPDSRLRIEVGVGLGVFIYKHPGATYILGEDTDNPGQAFVEDPFFGFSPALNSGMNITYALNDHVGLLAGVGNDFIWYHGDQETAMLRALTFGINYKL